MSKGVYCVELDKWFKSISEASRETGESIGKIRYKLKYFADTDGYTWRDDEWYKDYGAFIVEVYETCGLIL